MVTNRLLEMGDDFAASHDVVNVQFAKQQLRIPRIAFDESPRRTNKQSGGILRWNEKTKSYDQPSLQPTQQNSIQLFYQN